MKDFCKHTAVSVISTILLGQLLFCNAACSQDNSSRSFRLLNYLTGWSLDPTAGYHPCIYLYLMNVSNRDLSSEVIKFQGKFTDLQSAEITRGKLDMRRPLKPNQTTAVCLCANGRYQLPIQTHLWPVMEAKVMLRVGESSGDNTETVVTATIDPEVKSSEQAFSALNQISSFERKPAQAKPVQPARSASAAEKPVPARAMPLAAKSNSGTGNVATSSGQKLPSLFTLKGLPGLGDDFYNFEQFFGRPVRLDTDRAVWTWGEYKHAGTGARVFVGSHGRSGKADLILYQGAGSTAEADLLAGAAAFAGKVKGTNLEKPSKSVRYLPSGRLEITLQKGPAYNVACISADNASGTERILMLAKAAKDLDLVMFEPLKASKLLADLPFARGTKSMSESSSSPAPSPSPVSAAVD